jgi:TRAP-type transport system periplasmic protein
MNTLINIVTKPHAMKTLTMKPLVVLSLCLLALSQAASATVIKIATLAPEGTNWMKEMRAAGVEVKQKTEGRVELKYFPGGVMGNDAAVLRKIKLGQLQGGALSGAELSPIYPDAQIYSMPFLFRDLAEVEYVRKTVDPMLQQGFEKAGFVAVGMSGGGFAHMMSVKHISSKSELVATKVWVPQSDRIAQVAFTEAGVNPIALPLADVYTSLQTGLLETVANTTSGAIAFQWHTRIKHVVDLPLSYVMGIMVIDQRTFAKLSPEDQAVLRDSLGRAFRNLDAANKRDNEAARGVLIKQGVSFDAPNAAEAEYWRGVGARTLQTMQADGAISATLMSAITKAQAEYRAAAAKVAARAPAQ